MPEAPIDPRTDYCHYVTLGDEMLFVIPLIQNWLIRWIDASYKHAPIDPCLNWIPFSMRPREIFRTLRVPT